MLFISAILLGYIFGSIPFGIVLVRLAGLGDLRKVGPGTIGATNVLRTGRKDLAILTVLLDAFKAGLAYLLFYKLVPMDNILIFGQITTASTLAGLVAGTAAIIGHNFPVWLKFKGGKGVASTFGLILIASPIVGFCTILTWLATAVITRYSSVAAIMSAIALPVYTFFHIDDLTYFYFYSFLSAMLIIRHHTNISRLAKGTETKISFKKK